MKLKIYILENIKTILAENNISQEHTDDRMKKFSYKSIEVIGFSINQDSGFEYKTIPLCRFLSEFLEDTSIVITGCAFGLDSSSYLLIGCKELKKDEEYYEEILNMQNNLESCINKICKKVWHIYT